MQKYRVEKNGIALDIIIILFGLLALRDYKQEEPPNLFANGALIAEEIAKALQQKFLYQFETLLYSTYNMSVTDVTEIRDLDVLTDSEYDRKRRFEVLIAYCEEYVTYDPSIETAEIQQITIIT